MAPPQSGHESGMGSPNWSRMAISSIVGAERGGEPPLCKSGLGGEVAGDGRGGRCRRAGQPAKQRSRLCHRDPSGVRYGAEGVPGHIGVGCLVGVLNDGDAAAPLDIAEPGGTVVECPRQHDADDTGAIGDGGRPEEGVDGRSRTVLSHAVREAERPGCDQQVAVGWSHVDATRLNGLPVLSEPGRKHTVSAEDLAQRARRGRRCVLDDENGSVQVGLQPSYEHLQCIEPAE